MSSTGATYWFFSSRGKNLSRYAYKVLFSLFGELLTRFTQSMEDIHPCSRSIFSRLGGIEPDVYSERLGITEKTSKAEEKTTTEKDRSLRKHVSNILVLQCCSGSRVAFNSRGKNLSRYASKVLFRLTYLTAILILIVALVAWEVSEAVVVLPLAAKIVGLQS